MGAHSFGLAAIGRTADAAVPVAPAPAWDRFARWPGWAARALLAFVALLLVASAIVPITAGPPPADGSPASTAAGGSAVQAPPRDDDLQLYDNAIARIRNGENYYDFIVQEHRAADYPVRPAIAVRLPTLAYLDAWLGTPGQIAASILLLLGTLAAWWRRLGAEPGGRKHRAVAMALLFLGISMGLNRYYFVLHELWAGMLLALSFGLHRPGKWGGSLAAAALAVAIREHALPFVLLMGALAFWRRDWKEGAAWSALTIAFLALLAVHLHIVGDHLLRTDRQSPPWLVMRGLSGWLSDFALSSDLRFLPHWLAGPVVILAAMGWAGWRSPAGLFGTLLYGGYALLFMIAGRENNFYWGLVVTPAYLVGLAFVPMALASLRHSAKGLLGKT